jgi:SAM-dependent methyltransferase
LPLDLPAAQRQWWQSELGKRLLAEERAVLSQALQGSYGVHWGLLGPYPGYREDLAADIAHGFQFGHEIEPGTPIALRNDAAAWPLASETLTAVVLPHAYAHAEDPHALLREAHRVLRAEGIVVVLGWNPWSLWGARILLSRLWQIATRRRVRYPWCTRLLTAGRLREWCSVLGFEVLRVRHYGYQLPINSARAEGLLQVLAAGLRRLRLAPFAGGYCLVARKHVLPLTPIRPRWARRSVAVGAMVGQRAVESGTLPRMHTSSDPVSHD